jgi:hypothetical protein
VEDDHDYDRVGAQEVYLPETGGPDSACLNGIRHLSIFRARFYHVPVIIVSLLEDGGFQGQIV